MIEREKVRYSMTEQEILRYLRRIQCRPSIRQIAQLAQVDRGNPRMQMLKGCLTDRYKQSIERVLVQIGQDSSL